jgi:surfeit locus 1 family protein
MRGFIFTPEWRSIGLALLLLPCLVALGFWQLERAEEKTLLQAHFEVREQQGPVDIEELFDLDDLRYQPVRLSGEFVHQHTLFLDNRIRNQQFGYEVVTLFKLRDRDYSVFVNRGWVPGDRSRRSLPTIEKLGGMVDLVGEVHVPQSEMFTLGNEDSTVAWPRVMQTVNVSSLAAEFSSPVFPYTVRLDKDSPGSFEENWVVVNLSPEKHTGYAVQWFSMSVALALLVLAGNTNIIALIKTSK